MTTETTTETANESAIAHYRLNPDQSRLTVQAFAEGLLSAFGHDPVLAARDFTGEVQFAPGTFEGASVKISIKTESLVVISDDIKETDRHEIERKTREEVLEVAQYPEIVFASTNVSVNRLSEGRYRARVIGDLTLHGVTQNNLWIYVELTLSGESLRAQGDTQLKQTDFKIKRVSVAGGTLKIKSEVKVSFEIVGQKENEG